MRMFAAFAASGVAVAAVTVGVAVSTVTAMTVIAAPASAGQVTKCHEYVDYVFPDAGICARTVYHRTRIKGTYDHCRLHLDGVYTWAMYGTDPYEDKAYVLNSLDVMNGKQDKFLFSRTEVTAKNEDPRANKNWTFAKGAKHKSARKFYLVMDYVIGWKHNKNPHGVLTMKVGPINTCDDLLREAHQ
jgi:hypothetical protein